MIWNPYLPEDEYVPDAEPHVFGDRVYIYGSHDRELGDRFCMEDYTVYSADVKDLTRWTCHGISYRKSQDPRSRDGKEIDMYAPDCVRGNDGRYYLYYFAAGPNTEAFGPMSVAVSEVPEGPFEYHGDIRYKDGSPMLAYLTNDPAVINDDGRIYMYYGWGLGRDFRSKLMVPVYNEVLHRIGNRPKDVIKNTKPSILSCAVVEMEEDMVTVKNEPKAVLDSKTTADKKSDLYKHPFYEAASIRKFGELYYLVYSSGENCELCYATSKYPDHGFEYRGVIISNNDLGYEGNRIPKAAGGTIHGGIECINGCYYVFYHRCTNNTDFSRQTCAEPITIDEKGNIRQVEMTTQGLNGRALPAEGEWKAVLCCNLYNSKTLRVMGNGHQNDAPMITFDGTDRYIKGIDNGTVVGFKYFDYRDTSGITVTIRGGSGVLKAFTDINGTEIGKIIISPSKGWQDIMMEISVDDGIHALFLLYEGDEKIDFLCFNWTNAKQSKRGLSGN
ncbi:MAG: family 43 glycosylhydrolase [Butyrivibrio sp.]|nr:family 43 glycosylhydrolase [Butyrivibrio sp.]